MILRQPSPNDLVQIKQSYADVVANFKFKDADRMTLIQIQGALNQNATRIYDQFGRIIIKVGQGDGDYLDITSPRASFNKDTVRVDFLQTNSKGIPINEQST